MMMMILNYVNINGEDGFYQNNALNNLDVSVYNRQGAIRPVEASVSLWIG